MTHSPLRFLFMALGTGALLSSMFQRRHAQATELYLSQCDVALAHPRLSDPVDLDMADKTMGGSKQEFERYEWYVARLIYTLDECLRLSPDAEWEAVTKSQLGAHRAYLCSDYYSEQDYLSHYSPRIRALIKQQRCN